MGLDESLEEAAADLGATPPPAFRDITLPQILPALLAGGPLAFTFSLDDVIISTFVSIAGTSTLPVYIFWALRVGLKGPGRHLHPWSCCSPSACWRWPR